MAKTTTGNLDALPDEVGRLIHRKLRLMRRQAEMRLTAINTEMGQAVQTQLQEDLKARKSTDAIYMGALAAYRGSTEAILRVTAEWPVIVWGAAKQILDHASFSTAHGENITKLLCAHIWQPDEIPWTARWADPGRFTRMVVRIMGRCGLAKDSSVAVFERQLALESGKVDSAMLTRGRVALEEALTGLDEYLLAHCAGTREHTRLNECPDSKATRTVRGDRLHEFHPVTGRSRLRGADCEFLHSDKKTTLFFVADVEAIERDEDVTPRMGEEPALGPNRQAVRKRKTQAMYQAWWQEHERLKQEQPDKARSKRWCARQIARMKLAEGRDAETIRRQLQ